MTKLKVSIVTITYNQEKYIAQALESFVMQDAKFSFEVIVADDCSTDKTPSIIKEYARKHPEIIKPIFRKKNIGAIPNIMDVIKKAKGPFIALCEGDDFWTDPSKLQRQVDFLEKYKDYSMVFHPVRVFFENGETKDSIFPNFKTGFTINRLLQGNFIQTNSVMYRALSKSEYNKLAVDVMPGDWYLHLFHARFGEIGFIDRTMSVYRRHEGGLWWSEAPGFLEKIIYGHLRLTQEIVKIYSDDKKKQKIAYNFIIKLINRTVTSNNFNETIIEKISNNAPKEAAKAFRDNLISLNKLQAKYENLKEINRSLEDSNTKITTEIKLIKSSRYYIIRRRLTYPFRKLKSLIT